MIILHMHKQCICQDLSLRLGQPGLLRGFTIVQFVYTTIVSSGEMCQEMNPDMNSVHNVATEPDVL